MTGALGGWVLDHHAVAAWTRVEPYAQALVWSAMEIGMSVAVPVATLPFAFAATRESDHDVLGTLLDLPVTVVEPMTGDGAPELGRILLGADATGSDTLALACVVYEARRRGWPVLTGNSAAVRALGPDLDVDELP